MKKNDEFFAYNPTGRLPMSVNMPDKKFIRRNVKKSRSPPRVSFDIEVAR